MKYELHLIHKVKMKCYRSIRPTPQRVLPPALLVQTLYQWFRGYSGSLQRKRVADTSQFYSYNTLSCNKTDLCHVWSTGSSDVQTQAKPGNPIDL